jgi:alkylation response protein AidB-like acyl-CoA dehydrogenase
MTVVPAAERARQIADDLLYPSAMDVDAAGALPAAHLDALAAAGLYGLAGPADFGGMDADLATFCDVIEIMAAGCLATAFVWLQHHGPVRALAASANEKLRSEWLGPLCQGRRRAGIALGGARPGRPLLRARAVPGGYEFDGTSPWVTGWGMIDAVHALARDDTGDLVAALLPARERDGLTAVPLDLVAVNASRTVELAFDVCFVPADLVTSVSPHADWMARDASGLRVNGSLSLGVAARCCRLVGRGPLDRQLAAVRSRLDAADAAGLPAARAAAAEFALRAAAAAVVAAGSQSILTSQHQQRLAREALFLQVFGSRPAIKENLAGLLIRG